MACAARGTWHESLASAEAASPISTPALMWPPDCRSAIGEVGGLEDCSTALTRRTSSLDGPTQAALLPRAPPLALLADSARRAADRRTHGGTAAAGDEDVGRESEVVPALLRAPAQLCRCALVSGMCRKYTVWAHMYRAFLHFRGSTWLLVVERPTNSSLPAGQLPL